MVILNQNGIYSHRFWFSSPHNTAQMTQFFVAKFLCFLSLFHSTKCIYEYIFISRANDWSNISCDYRYILVCVAYVVRGLQNKTHTSFVYYDNGRPNCSVVRYIIDDPPQKNTRDQDLLDQSDHIRTRRFAKEHLYIYINCCAFASSSDLSGDILRALGMR